MKPDSIVCSTAVNLFCLSSKKFLILLRQYKTLELRECNLLMVEVCIAVHYLLLHNYSHLALYTPQQEVRKYYLQNKVSFQCKALAYASFNIMYTKCMWSLTYMLTSTGNIQILILLRPPLLFQRVGGCNYTKKERICAWTNSISYMNINRII